MKKIVKGILAQFDYILYQRGIKKSKIKVHSVEETIDELLYRKKSMVRFGDGDLTLVRGKKNTFQKSNPQLVEDLKRVLGFKYDNMIPSFL